MTSDKKTASLSRIEMETYIRWAADEKDATMYTADRIVRRSMDKLCDASDAYIKVREDDEGATYVFPKKLLSFRKPRVMSDDQREIVKQRLNEIRGSNSF